MVISVTWITPGRRGTIRTIAVTAVLLLLGACAVAEKTGEEITIEHAANQFIAAELKADDYCNSLGRRAEHVMTGPRRSSLLFIQASVSVFKCVVPKPVK